MSAGRQTPTGPHKALFGDDPKPLTRRELAWKTHTLTQDAAAYRAEVQRLRAELAELRDGQGQR